MKASEPPRLATWILERLAPGPTRESLVGDLIEQYHNGRSAGWYTRQVFKAVLVGAGTDLREHKVLAVRALVTGWTAWFLLRAVTGALRQPLYSWANQDWQSEILRQAVVYYLVPFAIITCLGFALTGWLIVRWHRRHRAAMVLVCALSQLPWAVWWGWDTWRLLRAGLWPFWDFRLALLFQAVLLFFGYPICILLGGLWEARSDTDDASRIPVIN